MPVLSSAWAAGGQMTAAVAIVLDREAALNASQFYV